VSSHPGEPMHEGDRPDPPDATGAAGTAGGERAADQYVDPEHGALAPTQDRREKASGPSSDPAQRPGPRAPGATGPDTPDGFGSFERPGRDGNWDDADVED